MIAKGEKKTLIPCYKNLDAYDMPKEFVKLQAQDMGKVGAMQDLLRGIKKILPKDPKSTTDSSVSATSTASTSKYLERAILMLEDGVFQKADEYFEKVLDQNPLEARAYFGKLLSRLKLKDEAALLNSSIDIDLNEQQEFVRALQFADPSFRSKLESISNCFRERPLIVTDSGTKEFKSMLTSAIVDMNSETMVRQLFHCGARLNNVITYQFITKVERKYPYHKLYGIEPGVLQALRDNGWRGDWLI